jgi:hypothetical protein
MMGLSNIETDGDGNRALIQWFALFLHPYSLYSHPSYLAKAFENVIFEQMDLDLVNWSQHNDFCS